MLSLDIKHPDSLDFIKSKRDLTQLTGANISVKIGEDFMKAVENDEDYILRFPCNIKLKPNEIKQICKEQDYNVLTKIEGFSNSNKVYYKKIKAKELWDEIIKSAHGSAEPGIIFEDNHHNYSPDGVYPQYKGVTTNPCGEIFMQEYDACRLIVTNLFSFVENPFTKDAYFNFKKFYEINYEAMRLADDIIDLELEHIDRIIEKIKSDPEPADIKKTELDLWLKIKETAMASRRAGLGFTALGDCLAALNLGYDSSKGLKMVNDIMYTKMESELDCTIDLAILRGTFEGWDPNLEQNASGAAQRSYGNSFYKFLSNNYPEQVERMNKYGRRNCSFSTVAPTGSVSILTQTTSGIEPLFQPFYTRRKKINPNDEGTRVDFVDDNGDTWQEFPVLHQKFKDWIFSLGSDTWESLNDFEEILNNKEKIQELFEQSPWYKSTADDIDWTKRVELQSIVQKYISHSISSTINLPSTVTEEEVSTIYLEAWKQGLKGITVYVDGSRSGVMVSNKVSNKVSFEYKDAVKRPKELKANVHTTSSQGKKYNVFVGLVDSKPYEVFITNHFTNEDNLILKKVKKGRYDLLKDGEVYSEDITTEMSESEEAITRLVSTSLRHGADIKFIVEQLIKTPSENMFSFTKSLVRVLKKYIPDGAESTVSCKSCGSNNVIFQEGCNTCLDCGSGDCS